ncbi:bestrophin-4 [Nilaparvata lugens]|uniref:bestrophin-4 n=1 Tax=Nilaparvata lugens TaxID=108931 RepID=UPI000B997B19|nr:bestrophin-4 [Nilaparvata lugens]
MTVTYTAEVATCRGFGCFLKLLVRWKGSIYKLVWPDLFAFLVTYYLLNFTYRFCLDEDQKKIFESVSEYCETYSNLIPLSFVLGFYISIIMTRWWDQYTTIPWPDPVAVFVSSHIHGQDERGRLMRRTIMRYVCLCLTMVFSMISPRVKKRFPTLDHFVDAGLLLENEKVIVVDLNEKFPRHSKHWLPIVWAASIVTRARKEGRIRDDFAVKTIIDELNKFRGQCGLLLNYDSISVPLVYTQVVTLATYSFFITSVMGRQWLDITDPTSNLRNHRNPIDLYFPVFTTLQFFFYMGWLKVAESLINPFGEDDDDFEVNWIVDRNVQVSYLIVDEMHHEHPELIRDQYWDEVLPTELPYTVAAEPFREKHPQPSTANIAVSNAEAEYVAPSSLKIDDINMMAACDDNQSGIHFSAGPKRSTSRVSMYSRSRERTMSAGSSNSINTNIGSIPNSLHRVGSVTSVLKRLFSRDGSAGPGVAVDGGQPVTSGGKLPVSHSTDSLQGRFQGLQGGGSIRITDQVIEEVDEQQTITSMRGQPEQRPNVRSIFPQTDNNLFPVSNNQIGMTQLTPGHPPSSAPVPVPPGRPSVTHLSSSAPPPLTAPVSPAPSTVTYTEVLSVKSAPGFDNSSGLGSGSIGPNADAVSIGSSTDTSEDEFSKLRQSRRRERMDIRYARSISAQQAEAGSSPPESESLLDLTADSRTGLIPKSKVNDSLCS